MDIKGCQTDKSEFMGEIKIHVLRTGEVRVSPYLPFGGDDCSIIKASGITTPRSKWIWLPVFSFLIEHPKGLVLFDDIDYVLLSHLDCDHANGLRLVKDAKNILVSKAEMIGTTRKNFQIRIRFQKRWWEGVDLKTFDWNGTEGPAGKSYDVLGDGSLVMVNIPGHSEGLCALKIKNTEGKYVLLFADGGYATKSWRDMITSGITLDKKMQRQSLQWIREQSMSPDCIESLATHDTEVQPHVIEI